MNWQIKRYALKIESKFNPVINLYSYMYFRCEVY